MPYAQENALFQWRDGEQRVRDAEEPERRRLERAVDLVLEELRRRLGSSFTVAELAAMYGEGTDWATDLVQRRSPGVPASEVVDAAFARYAREARVRPDF
ncbi:MAG TPA: hypothetical protein VGF21_16905 [Thermoleophilaceae bacterium]